MLKRDSLTAQMEQLSQVLAKVKRLILEEEEIEANKIISLTFHDYFMVSDHDLIHTSLEEFIHLLKDKKFKAEEVNMLAYFIDEYAGMQDELANQILLYRKLIKVFDYLEQEFQFLSLDHINRRSILEAQL